MKLRLAAAGLALAAAAACEPQAKPAALTGASALPQSKERESCAATSDCEAPLRCVEGACQSPSTSRLGEYYWIAGEVAAEKGDNARALSTYQLAMARYDEDKVAPPPRLACDYGAALRRKAGDPKAAEQAARLLHRCLLTSAAGSREHTGALRELAQLEPLGLDPTLLARGEPADTYLTMPPRKPAAESLKLTVKTDPASKDKGYVVWAKALEADSVRALLVPCFEEYFASTQKATAEITLPTRYKARWDDDEELYIGGTIELTAPAGLPDADAKAAACARAALAPVATEFGKKGSFGNFSGTVVLRLSAAP